MKKILSRLFNQNNDEHLSEILNNDTQDMIRGIRELSETTVREVVVPRIDVVSLSTDLDESAFFQKIVESGHSRFPIYQDTIDNVIGIVYVKDIMAKLIKKERITLKDNSRNAYFVPETMKLDTLLREMKRRHIHIAVVVDEYGGMNGIVCMEDILEKIIGDIQDEFDDEQEDIIKIGENSYLCDAQINIDDLNEKIHLELPFNDFDTLGGYVFDLFGKIPTKNEKVTKNECTFIVEQIDRNTIRKVKLIVNRKDGSTEE